jgi:hypothetical protein
MRHLAGLDIIPPSSILPTDNIIYLAADELPNGFKHPHCLGAGTDVVP